MKKGPKKIPQFKTEDEERQFWLTHSAFDYWDQMEPVNEPIIITKPRKQPITMMFDPDLKRGMELLAREERIGYQTLAQRWLLERCKKELQKRSKQPSAAGRRLSRIGSKPTARRVKQK